MHLFTLVAFLTLAGTPNRPIPAGCSEDYGTCREDCTIEFGGSTTKYRQLGECLRNCDKEQTECTRRHYALRDTQGTNSTPSSGRQGVYRASEAEPATPPESPAPPAAPAEPPAKQEPVAPAPKPAAEPEKLEMRTFDDPEPEPAPAPKPAPKPAEAPRAKPPPEPKKKDISDWDPNGN
jgi:hypothetical protein